MIEALSCFQMVQVKSVKCQFLPKGPKVGMSRKKPGTRFVDVDDLIKKDSRGKYRVDIVIAHS